MPIFPSRPIREKANWRVNYYLPFALSKEVREGVIFGTFGAYVYVLMMLGERTFQRDITPGTAIWSSVQLFLGPVLGGLLAAVLASGEQIGAYSYKIAYFFAGLAPRQLVNIISETVRRFLAGGQTLPQVKSIPLQSIRGISQRIEDRLFEEGITDGYLLAMANPIRLHRNTPYDVQQIVAWCDECLLYALVPEYADALQKDGISGAIDLAYYWEMGPNGAPALDRIEALAKRINADDMMLQDIIRRMDEDGQVQLIWSLYQSVGDG
jgi:hypothetical protein